MFAVSGALGVALFDGEDPSHSIARLMINATRWIISRLIAEATANHANRKRQAAGAAQAHFLVEFMAKLSAELAGENEVSITR